MTDASRDDRILQLIARYKLMTADILHRVVFEGLSPKAPERVLGRLRKQRLIVSFPLAGRLHYYTLTPRGARRLGLSEKRAGESFGPQSLIQNYSILLYCLGIDVRRNRLQREEFKSHFPTLAAHPGVACDRYYLQSPGPGQPVRIALLVTDFASHPARLVRKCRREVHKRESSEPWRDAIAAGLFQITLLTAFPGKAERLQKLLGAERFPVVVEVIPGLAGLLASQPFVTHGRTRRDCDLA